MLNKITLLQHLEDFEVPIYEEQELSRDKSKQFFITGNLLKNEFSIKIYVDGDQVFHFPMYKMDSAIEKFNNIIL